MGGGGTANRRQPPGNHLQNCAHPSDKKRTSHLVRPPESTYLGTAPLTAGPVPRRPVPSLPVIPAMTPAASASLPALVAVLAINRAIRPRFKRDCGLLSAIGTRHGGSLSFVRLVLACCALFILFCLAACGATLGIRIPAHLEEFLIFARKRKFLSAVGAGQ